MKKIFTKENMKKFFRTYIWLGVLLFVIDIVTKWVVFNHFGLTRMSNGVYKENGAIQIIKNFIYIGGAINPNAAYSFHLFSKDIGNRIFFASISVILSGCFIWYYVKNYKKLGTWVKVSLILMISGGIGNLIDRCFYWDKTVGFSGVIDWIQFYVGGVQIFGSFNIADACLVIGIIILVIVLIIDEIKEAMKKGKDGEYKYSPKELEEKKNAGNKGN